MQVFVIGVTGRVGSLLAERLVAQGDRVRGLVRRAEQQQALAGRGITAVVGDLTSIGVAELATAYGACDVVVYCAGTEGSDTALTDALDHDGVVLALDAAVAAGTPRFVLLSAMPEAWRERSLPDELEHYFATKKRADVVVAGSGLDWLVLRPSELTDGEETGLVALGAAQHHEHTARADVAATLAALVHSPSIRRRVLELNQGRVPLGAAVEALEVDGSQPRHEVAPGPARRSNAERA